MNSKISKVLAVSALIVMSLMLTTVILSGCDEKAEAESQSPGCQTKACDAKKAEGTCPLQAAKDDCPKTPCEVKKSETACPADCDKACCEAKKADGTCPLQTGEDTCPKVCPKSACETQKTCDSAK